MPFDAECTFCRLALQGVPDERLGCSVRCPRCGNHFTLAELPRRVTAATRGPRIVRKKTPASSASAVIETPVVPSPAEPDPAKEQQPVRVPLQPDHGIYIPAPPKRSSVAESGSLVSFVLGSAAFLLAAITHVGLITLLVGAIGFLLGILGWHSSARSAGRPLLRATGLVVNLAAVIFAVVFPNVLGVSPLWSGPATTTRGQTAVISLSGDGGFRNAAEGESPWVDASRDALHHGDIRVRILSVVVGMVAFEPIPGKKPQAQRGLMIRLRITNAGITRKIPYTSWGDAQPPVAPLLHDNQGKSYRLKDFGPGFVVKGRAAHSTIPSGKSVEDVLVFESPPNNIKFLHLELAAAAAGVEGQLRIEIPRNMIVFH